MAYLFWIAAATIGYVYLGYPVLLRWWAKLAPRPLRAGDATGDLPGVSIVVAARNEASVLAARLDNLLALDYPADRRQIIVVSDGSTDDTLAILASYGDRIHVVAQPRAGKARALNTGVAIATFDLIVFADARQVFAPDALRELVAPFADPAVGGVTGELLLDCESPLFSNRRCADRRQSVPETRPRLSLERRSGERRRAIASPLADGIGMYWHYEKQLRRWESAINSTLGTTGAIYAMRRAAWTPLPADTLLDDVLIPMRAVLAGYRVVFNDRARAYDRVTPTAEAEAQRKVRTLAGNYQILCLEPRLLLPWRNPVWFQYLSHKIGRLVVPFAMIAVWCTSVMLASHAIWYTVALGGQVLLYLLAAYGAVLERMRNRGAVPVTARPVRAARPRYALAMREVA